MYVLMYNTHHGYVIDDIEYGTEDYVVYRIFQDGELTKPRRNKLRYDVKGEPYFMARCGRKYLKDFVDLEKLQDVL